MNQAVVALKAEPRAQGRFDLYREIHKALRSIMSEALLLVGRMDAADAQEVTQAAGKVRALIEICRQHLHTENQFVHPAMEARRPRTACETAEQHVEHEQALERLEAATRAVEQAGAPARGDAAHRLYQQLALFVAENLVHMHVEETHNNGVLWEAYSDAELLALHGAILASIAPEKMMAVMPFILSSVNHTERHAMLEGMSQKMPREAFRGVLAVAQSCLAQREWTKLGAALGTAPRVA
jgi:hypothetical protein